MTVEQQLRDHYETTTTDVLGGPDLESVLGSGRRRRRVRIMGVAGTAAAAVTVGAVVASSLVSGGSSPTAKDPARGADVAAAPVDFVPGTTIDDDLQQVVAGHLSGLGAPTDVYPSDWDHNGPMPDADFADATDWQAAYDLGADEKLLVFMGWPKPGEPPPTKCPECEMTEVPGGRLLTQVSFHDLDADWHFMTVFVRDDGFTVGAIDQVVAPEAQDAAAARSVSDAEAEALATDPALQFPMPEGR